MIAANLYTTYYTEKYIDQINAIKFYGTNGKYKIFSNFYPAKFVLKGKTWPSSEHYFQAMKFSDYPEYQETIRKSKSAYDAKKLGATRTFKIRKDWNDIRDDVMRTALKAKFEQNCNLRSILLQTGEVKLVENSPYDNYWGIGKYACGKNMLGKLLMELRTDLRKPQELAVINEDDEDEDVPEVPRLRRELSMAFVYPSDKTIIDVPLRFRLGYDRVVSQIDKLR